ncbi:hypothetical protein NIES4101_53390 [Calothrix sp. NIES-4101]|nr:hypothetical protein NIES4101_53390 [Calothrix sp. NIES-4101]
MLISSERFYKDIVPGAYFAVSPPVTQYCQVVKIVGDVVHVTWQDGSQDKRDRDFFLSMKHIPPAEFYRGYGKWRVRSGLHPTTPPLCIRDDWFIRWDTLPICEQIALCQERIRQQKQRIADYKKNVKSPKQLKKDIDLGMAEIRLEKQIIDEILAEAIPSEYSLLFSQLRSRFGFWAAIQELERIQHLPISD